jgi:alpha-L-fucosidase
MDMQKSGKSFQMESKIRMYIFNLLLIFCAGFGVSALAADAQSSSWPYENETKEQRDARMQWWREARFGMFIHWGVYSVPAGTYNGKQIPGIGEWIMNRGKIPVAEYKAYAKQFNPVRYNPDKWVRLAKEAGMKYIIITSKHHDGFALFDSKVTDWDVVDATPYGKDLLKPLAQACKKHGIKLGFYYSQAQDWNHPGGAASGGHWDPAQDGDMNEYIRTIAAPQVKEILTHYGKIAVLWWDTPTNMNKERADMLQPLITLQPNIITNNRLGGGYKGDNETPEQHIPATGLNYDWETCMTMNDTWGFKSYDNNWKSTKVLIQNLVDIASKGGNYLLNVGPTSLGEIPQPSIERLQEIGKWMKINGESIYDTTASPFAKLTWGRCTKKESDKGAILYLHVFDWPTDGTLVVPGLKNKVKQAYLLANRQTETNPVFAIFSAVFRLFAGPKNLKMEIVDDGVKVYLPQKPLDAVDTVVVLKIDGKLQVEKILPEQSSSGTVTLTAETADIHNRMGSDTKLETRDRIQNISYWTDEQVWVDWSFRIDKPGRFEIAAYLAVEAPKSGFEIIIDDQKQNAEVVSTGGYDKFVKTKLGEITLTQPGEHKLQIKPIEKQWQPINLRTILLTPIGN